MRCSPPTSTDGAACFDITVLSADWSEYDTSEGKVIKGIGMFTLRTGLAFEVPPGYVMLVYSRSGHGFKHDTRLANCVGVIDSDYRGELFVKLTRDYPFGSLCIMPGDRIAQAMVIPVPAVQLVEVDELSDTARGTGGLGSTGA